MPVKTKLKIKRAAAASPDPTSETSPLQPPLLSLSLRNKKRKVVSLSKRFRSAVSEEESSAAKGVVPSTTKVSNDWALRNLRIWMEARSKNCAEKLRRRSLKIYCLVTMRRCIWLCQFVQETGKENSENYPPSTIRSLLLLSAFQ